MNQHEDFTNFSKLADMGRWHITQFVRQVAKVLPRGCILLDAGAGECLYRKFFSHCRYVGVDSAVGEPAWNYQHLDCIAVLDQLPFVDGSFDAILSTQTLEHLELPVESIRELFRVLKPNGKLFITAPMAHAEHQTPYDFFRYTSFGLKSLCRRAGFSQVLVTPLGGVFVRWAYELPYVLSMFPNSGLRQGRPTLVGITLLPLRAATFLLIRVMQIMLSWIDLLDRRKEFPFGWSLIATKPV